MAVTMTMKVTVELPAEAGQLEGTSLEALARDLRLLWILDRVRAGRISAGKGAQIAGLDRWEFMRVMNEHGIPVINYSVEELRRDADTLRSL